MKNGRKTEKAVVKILESGAKMSAQTLVDFLSDETATNSQKLDCAKEILNRLYGKTFENSEGDGVSLELSEAIKKYSE